MLYVATVHFRSPRWIEIQTDHLRKHIPVPYQAWGSFRSIDSSYAVHFDRVFEHPGGPTHAEKLNHLALEISQVASDDDLLMFLDGDAFPIADLGPVLATGLEQAPLLAVRRVEEANEPHPHPCFCLTTVGFWRTLPGDWSRGFTWVDEDGTRTSGVGANLLRALDASQTPWRELHRTNSAKLHSSLFAIYGHLVYHHGAAFRTKHVILRAQRESAPAGLLAPPRIPGLGFLMRRMNARRWRRWERDLQERNQEISQNMYERIARSDPDWLASVAGSGSAGD